MKNSVSIDSNTSSSNVAINRNQSAASSSLLPGSWSLVLPTDRRWWVLIGASGVSAAVAILMRRRRRQREARARRGEGTQPGSSQSDIHQKRRGRPSIPKSGSLSDSFTWNTEGVDIGAVLGVDIGGTLSKLVYFEKKAPSRAESKRRQSEDPMGKKVHCSPTYS